MDEQDKTELDYLIEQLDDDTRKYVFDSLRPIGCKCKDDKKPKEIRELERRCMCCEKTHIVCGGYIVKKLIHKNVGGVIYVTARSAPLGCWLAHNKKFVEKYYQSGEYKEWLRKEKGDNKEAE